MIILGTTWNMTSDTIFVNGSETSSCPVTSKREALQSISRIYDPLGIFFPSYIKWNTVSPRTLEKRARLGRNTLRITTATVVQDTG